MNDIINLLPDAVANQIAAGEVIQRPASVVKELLENAVDAHATKIELVIKTDEKRLQLIQVIDNGKGMSFKDARMCFERHATSKINSADDLYHLSTKGFRGEALASIASVARLELKTKQADNETGTVVVIEGSTIKEHAPTVCPEGTSIAVKDLFFNIPARYNFLKSDSVEYSHVEEEFLRVALVHCDIAFYLIKDEKTIFLLTPSNFKQRIINALGGHFKEKLYPIELNTDVVTMSGFIGKPENAKKSKPEQYLFINDRFVKHSLFTFAIEKAYQELVPEKHHPPFFIKITVDPATIDVNISPTKTDIKFQEEKLLFGFLNAAVKKTLGTMSLVPQIDFNYDRSMDFERMKPSSNTISQPTVTRNYNYNPFDKKDFDRKPTQNAESWTNFFESIKNTEIDQAPQTIQSKINFLDANTDSLNDHLENDFSYVSIDEQYIAFNLANQLAIVDIVGARERILYDKYVEALNHKPIVIQQTLFPETIIFSASNADLLSEMQPDLYKLGYDIESMGNNQFAVNGIPFGEETNDIQQSLECFIESYKANSFITKGTKENSIALSMAKQKRSKFSAFQNKIEVKDFLKQLFDCAVPFNAPSNHKIINVMTIDNLKDIFK
ncbi:MAG: DNA mismatch repair endonuclease MutL [Bacteroidales bacterium]|jgi:DNA mismatch repair protein MutL|nr:DNA mismatch repair endonuclease MutL [Bacteroidales bacterium]